jgi:hypothetical protein
MGGGVSSILQSQYHNFPYYLRLNFKNDGGVLTRIRVLPIPVSILFINQTLLAKNVHCSEQALIVIPISTKGV